MQRENQNRLPGERQRDSGVSGGGEEMRDGEPYHRDNFADDRRGVDRHILLQTTATAASLARDSHGRAAAGRQRSPAGRPHDSPTTRSTSADGDAATVRKSAGLRCPARHVHHAAGIHGAAEVLIFLFLMRARATTCRRVTVLVTKAQRPTFSSNLY